MRVFVGIALGLILALEAGDSSAQVLELAPAAPGLQPTLACVEPIKDTGGNALGIARGTENNGLLGCYSNIKAGATLVWESWLKPDSPAGGKRHELGASLPSYIGSYPVEVACVCFNRAGWGPPKNGRVALSLTILP